jgi:SAM-dependent methyltransferase
MSNHHGHGHAVVPVGEAAWDERYRSADALWSGRPNAQLVTEASELVPGTALDVACGEGADAVWLAARGWRVTGVDISTVALGRAAAHARDAGVEVDWLQVDLDDWVPAARSYDLVSMQFMHLPPADRDDLVRRLAGAVSAGGCLLVVGHHPSDVQTVMPRPMMPERFYTAAELAAALDPREWEVVVADARTRTALDPDGRSISIQDTVFRARRIPNRP